MLQEVPDGISLVEFRKLGPKYSQAAVTICTSFETMGLMVHKRVAPLDLVLDLAGGIVTTMRRKLARWLEEIRVEQNQPSFAEWFDWLGQVAEREKTRQAPAQIAYRDWQP